METTQRGSGNCSYRRLIVGAILFVSVPAMIIRSEWRGEARKTTPNLSISYRLIAAWIISTAQQAKPNVRGHKDPALAQDITEINLEEIHSSFINVGR